VNQAIRRFLLKSTSPSWLISFELSLLVPFLSKFANSNGSDLTVAPREYLERAQLGHGGCGQSRGVVVEARVAIEADQVT